MNIYDLVIIGGGPAGMSAAINAVNDGLEFKLYESKGCGWFPKVSIDSHYAVDNYLGFPNYSGTQLISNFVEHILSLGIKSEKSYVNGVSKKKDCFSISADKKINAKSIIISTGTIQKKLKTEGLDKFLGKSVFYYCTPNYEKFMGKKVWVVGGRNTGAVTAIYLKEKGCDVGIIEKDHQLNANQKYLEKINLLKIQYKINSEVISLEGKDNLEKINIKTDKGIENLPSNGLFICIGLLPNNHLARQLGVNINKEGYVLVDQNMATNISGVYAAGDITGNLKQISVAVAQGAIAEYNINKFLREKWKKE